MSKRSDGSMTARVDLYLAVCLFLAALLSVVITLGDPGLAWDEPAYLGAGARIISHVSARLSGGPSPVSDPWDRTSAHPVFGKIAVAACMAVFEPVFGDYVLAGRMAGALSYAGVTLLVFLLLRRSAGRAAALAGALCWALFPRAFGHAHFAALDMPLAFLFLATVAAFHLERGRAFAGCLSGVLWGLALGVKVNAIFLPAFLIPVALLQDRRQASRQVVLFLGIGALVFLALFFPMWQDGPRQLVQYFTGGAVRAAEGQGPLRTPVPVFYMGHILRGGAPWHYYPVMLLAVSPVVFVVFAVVGALRCLREPAGGISSVLLVGVLVTVGGALLPPFPKYDGVRLILYAMPLLACLAGVGAGSLLARIRRPSARALVGGGIVLLIAAQIALFHPYQLSYYSPAVGSLRGAYRLGFEVTYWHESNDAKLFDYLYRQAPANARIAFYPVGSAAGRFYYELVYLREDLEIAEIGASDTLATLRARGISLLVVNARRSYLEGSALETSLEGLLPSFYNSVPLSGLKLSAVYRIE